MTTLASNLLNSFCSKLDMKLALESKVKREVSCELSGYADIVRELGIDNVTMQLIQGDRKHHREFRRGIARFGVNIS